MFLKELFYLEDLDIITTGIVKNSNHCGSHLGIKWFHYSLSELSPFSLFRPSFLLLKSLFPKR